MSEEIKLTQEEMDEFKALQATYQEKTYEFGTLYIDKLNLEEQKRQLDKQEAKIKQDIIDNQKKEQGWVEKISAKYGEGTLNPTTGTFIPNPK